MENTVWEISSGVGWRKTSSGRGGEDQFLCGLEEDQFWSKNNQSCGVC